MPLPLQAKILRLVQERQFERVGGHQTLSVDVRVVAATNRDLEALVAQKQFREDLFFRLSVDADRDPAAARAPPRRAAPGRGLPAAATRARWAGRTCSCRRTPKRALAAHSWPGNVRELQNCLERAAILCDGHDRSSPRTCASSPACAPGPALADVIDLSGPLAEVPRARRGRGPRRRRSPSRSRGRRRPRGGRRAARGQPVDAQPAAARPRTRPGLSSLLLPLRAHVRDEHALARRIAGGVTSTSSSSDQLERLLEVQLAVRRQADRLVGGRGAHVGELLLLR